MSLVVPDIHHVPFPHEYRGWTTARSLDALRELLHTRVAPDRVAAVIIEPVLGEGGFVPAPAAFLQELRRITARHGIAASGGYFVAAPATKIVARAVDKNQRIDIEVDGEILGPLPATFQILPGALRVRCPR